jgi:S1-C subfamily serine protease
MENNELAQARKRRRPLLLIAIILIPLLFGVGVGLGAATIYFAQPPATQTAYTAYQPAAQATPTPISVAVQINTAITDAVADVGPAVVTVVNHVIPQRTLFGSLVSSTAMGSGVIITQDGYIVTNYHVVENNESLEVILTDGTTLDAELVGSDALADLAVLHVDGSMPAVASWGNSDSLLPGETVIAIGSPLGNFKNTVTVGVVSATNRSIDTASGYQMQDMIQTDAAINEGNSGGPLINLAGQIVGINSLVVRGGTGATTVAEGLGFAIASNTARAVTEQLIQKGYVARPNLGIQWQWVTPQIATRYNLPVDYGAYISQVESGSPADKAGLQRGDILISIGGQTLDADHPFINVLLSHNPGESVALEVMRDGNQIHFNVTLGQTAAP